MDNSNGTWLTSVQITTEPGGARTFEPAEQGQVTDRYTKAIEQLGSDKLDVRIGGIYALERVARDSARDHPAVIEVLAAFIREHSHERWPPSDPDGREQARRARPDVQATVTVVGRRDAKRDIERINLSGANLFVAHLRGADLTGANLYSADLTGADLTGADLNSADLTRADLTRADLTRADLTGAHLHGAILTGANLTDARWPDARWPRDAPVPVGWKLDTGSGRLERAGTGPGPTEAN